MHQPVFPRQATQAHFDDLRERYGDTVVVLNLLKGRERRPRETLLRREFAAAVTALNRKVVGWLAGLTVGWLFSLAGPRLGQLLVSVLRLPKPLSHSFD